MESDTESTQTTAAKASRRVRWPLAVTTAVESVLVIGLTLRDFTLTQSPTATFGSVTLLAISGVSAWAAQATLVQSDSWLVASLLSQFSIAVLAGYIVLIDLRSPFLQFFGITGLACVLGTIALFWLFSLIRRWHGPVSAGLKAIAALIPLVGFVQFWLQTDYLPRTSLPLVDVTTDLTPTGTIGDIVQLEAKVTINNRDSVPVNVGATLMRITAYPQATGKPTEVPDAIEFGFVPSVEYRDDPLPVGQRQLLYAKDVIPAGSVLAAGQSSTFHRVVDFNSRTMRLARLAVDAIFITSPRIAKVYTCPPPPGIPATESPKSQDDHSFQDEISKVAVNSDGARFLCRDIRLVPRNVIHEMVGDQPGFAVMAIFNDPKHPSAECPKLLMLPGAHGKYDGLTSRQNQKLSDANPTMTYYDMAVEYSPSEKSAPTGQK